MIGGLGRFQGHTVMVIGQEKGSDTEGRVAHNFGMANPEGYRKASRLCCGWRSAFRCPC